MEINSTFIKHFKYRNINRNTAKNRRGGVAINIYAINKGVRKIKNDVKKTEFYEINKEKIKFEVREINKRISEIAFNIYTISFIIEILYKKRVTLIIRNPEASIIYNIIFINNFFNANIIFIKYYIRNFKLIF